MTTEYNNSTVGAACGYSTLSHYNNGGPPGVPVPDYVRGVSDRYVVPEYGLGFGYNALTHGQNAGTCSGFFNITNAYGRNANNCNTRYVQTLCNGGFVGGCKGTRWGCCPGSNKAAAGPNHAGCGAPIGGCKGTRWGCCPGSNQAASGPNHAGCNLGKDCWSRGLEPCLGGPPGSCCGKAHNRCAAKGLLSPDLCPKKAHVHGCCPKLY